MSAPLPPNEAERLAELRRSGLLDTRPEKTFKDITALAPRIFEVPISTVTLIDSARQWFNARQVAALGRWAEKATPRPETP